MNIQTHIGADMCTPIHIQTQRKAHTVTHTWIYIDTIN